MKKLIFIFTSIMFIFIFGCSDGVNKFNTPQDNNMIQLDLGGYDTLDLSIDPVQIGGMSEIQVNNLLGNGYYLDTLQTARLFNVEFSSDGGIYYRVGYVRAGEVMLILNGSIPVEGYFTGCGNQQLELFD